MEKCPEKEILGKFVESELSEQMMEKVFQHVEGCEKCQNKVKCLINNERDLFHSLFMKLASFQNKDLSTSEKCHSKLFILAYALKCLDDKHLRMLEVHLEKCDKCLSKLIGFQRNLSEPSEIDLNMSILKESMGDDITTMRGILDIVVEMGTDILQLISHTGELLSPRVQLGAVRGNKKEQAEAIIIRKDMEQKDLSLQINLSRESDDHDNTIEISLMKLSNEHFIPGIGLSLSGMGMQRQEKTNTEGIAVFYGIKSGRYLIKLNYDIIASIHIKKQRRKD